MHHLMIASPILQLSISGDGQLKREIGDEGVGEGMLRGGREKGGIWERMDREVGDKKVGEIKTKGEA